MAYKATFFVEVHSWKSGFFFTCEEAKLTRRLLKRQKESIGEKFVQRKINLGFYDEEERKFIILHVIPIIL